MAEETLAINASINIDETPGINATNEVDPTTLSTLMSTGLYDYIDDNYMTGGETLGTPDNATHQTNVISTPDGFDNLSWTDVNGDPLNDSTSLMALDPDSGNYETVTISTDTNDDVLIGTTSSGNIAFIAAIDPNSQTSSDIFLLTFLPMQQTDTTDPDDIVSAILTDAYITVSASQSFDDFSDAPSGANDWLAFGDSSSGIQLLATSDPYEIDGDNAVDPDEQSVNSTVNSSNIGLGTNKQSVEVGDMLRLDLVNGAITGDALTSTLSHDADAITFDDYVTGVQEMQFGLVQTGGNADNRVDLNVQALFVDSSGHLDTDDDALFFHNSVEDGTNETSVAIERVEVLDSTGAVVAYYDTTLGTPFDNSGDSEVQISLEGGGTIANCENLIEDYSVRVYATGDINRLEITNDSDSANSLANKTFDVGAVEVGNVAGDTDQVTMNFEDDGPSISNGGTIPDLTVDETDLTTDASAGFSGIFSTDFGEDTPGTVGYELVINGGDGTDSGLNDSLTGDDILLRVNGSNTVIEGYLSGDPGTGFGDGTVAFTVSVDGSGNVALDQSRAMEHLDGTDPDDSVSPDANTIGLKATVNDKEGDSVDLTRDISGNLLLKDDAPSVTADGDIPTLVTDDTDTPNDTDTQSFAGVFTVDYGADGPKDVDDNGADADALVYTLGITGGDGTDSGLNDSLTGDDILLRVNASGTVVEGYLANDTTTVAFTITLDSSTGSIEQKQDRSVEHSDSTDADEAASPATLSAANLITLTATAKDGDDGNEDSAFDTANIGQAFTFKDDGPSVVADGDIPTLVTDDSDTPDDTDTQSFADVFTVDYGADGPKDDNDDGVPDADALAYTLGITGGNGTPSGLNDSLTGDAILLRVNAAGTEIEGYLEDDTSTVAFTITVDGSGNVTQEQDRAVEHDDSTDPDESTSPATLAAANLITLTATAMDGDDGNEDSASDTANIGQAFTFKDDGPSVTADGTIPTLVTDDSDTPDDTDTQSFAGVFTVDYGADGPKDVDNNGADIDALVYTLGITGGNGTDSGLDDTLTGDNILLRVNAAGTEIEGYLENDTSTVAFTITVDGSGNITQEQDRSVVHDDATDPDESSSPATLSAANLITLTATATDGDNGSGDTASDTADIGTAFTFKDDGPTNTGAADGSVKFVFTDSEPDGVPDTTNNDGYFSDTGFLDYGADGEGSFVFINYTEQMPDDTVLGEITETLSDGNTKITYSSATYGDLFEITLDGTEPGGYTFVALQSSPLVLNPLGISTVDAGGPSETETVPSPSGTWVTFDGFLSTNFTGDPLVEYAAGNLPPPPAPDGDDDDDVNISTPGIGLKDNQMDPGEQLRISFSEDEAGTQEESIQGIQLQFEGGTGSNSTFDIRFVAYDNGTQVADVTYEDEALPKGNDVLLVDFLPGESFDVETDPFLAGESFDEVFVFINFDGPKNGVRISEVSLYEQSLIPDFEIDYETRATDGDGDYVDDAFTVQVDADNDGVFNIV